MREEWGNRGIQGFLGSICLEGLTIGAIAKPLPDPECAKMQMTLTCVMYLTHGRAEVHELARLKGLLDSP